MQSIDIHASGGVRVIARPFLPERRLSRYVARHQNAVRRVAARHERLADLAVSFPALLFALAVPRPRFDPEPVIRSAIGGASLKSLSAAAETPLWLRGLGPEAFVRPLGALPNGPSFRWQIRNHMPRSPKLAPIWLEAVENASAWADEKIAAWVAREILRDPKSVKKDKLRFVCLWAWYSSQLGAIGHSLIDKGWAPPMRFTAACQAAAEWRTNLLMYCDLGERGIEDTWLRPGQFHGLEFIPIATAADLREEAKAMKNCVRTYSFRIAQGHLRIWSIRKEGRRIATVEIYRVCGDPYLRIGELRAVSNNAAPTDIWRATHLWLRSQDSDFMTPCESKPVYAPINRDVWIALWRPYWLEKRRLEAWLPLAPSQKAIWQI
jgi:hypothetical protein